MTHVKRRLIVAACFLVTCAPLSTLAQSTAKTGDLHPSYIFAATGESMAYRLYVPSTYDGKKPMPLVVLLHGSRNDENSAFDRAGDQLKQLAEKHGYIIVSPRGYNAFGGYGNIYPVVVTQETAKAGASFAKQAATGGAAPPPPSGPRPPLANVAVPADDYAEQPAAELTDAHVNQLSEQETLAAITDVRKNYNTDVSRTYLTGNSMGGVGTAYLAAKYPTQWAAVAPGGGPVAAWSYPFSRLRLNAVPVLFVHGEFDEHSNPHWSEVLADAAKADGVKAQFLLVKGAHHGDAWLQALPQIFDFFDSYHR